MDTETLTTIGVLVFFFGTLGLAMYLTPRQSNHKNEEDSHPCK